MIKFINMSNSTIKEIRKYLSQPQINLGEGVKQIRAALDNLEKAAVSSGIKSQADALRLLSELEEESNQLEQEHADLKKLTLELQN